MKKAKIQLAINSQINEVLKNKVHLSEHRINNCHAIFPGDTT